MDLSNMISTSFVLSQFDHMENKRRTCVKFDRGVSPSSGSCYYHYECLLDTQSSFVINQSLLDYLHPPYFNVCCLTLQIGISYYIILMRCHNFNHTGLQSKWFCRLLCILFQLMNQMFCRKTENVLIKCCKTSPLHQQELITTLTDNLNFRFKYSIIIQITSIRLLDHLCKVCNQHNLFCGIIMTFKLQTLSPSS